MLAAVCLNVCVVYPQLLSPMSSKAFSQIFSTQSIPILEPFLFKNNGSLRLITFLFLFLCSIYLFNFSLQVLFRYNILSLFPFPIPVNVLFFKFTSFKFAFINSEALAPVDRKVEIIALFLIGNLEFFIVNIS